MEKEELISQGAKIGEYIRSRLQKEVAALGVLGEVRGQGALSCVEFVEEMETKRSFPDSRNFGKRVEKRLLKKGLILRCDPHWIGFAPPLITTIPQADEIVNFFVEGVADELKNVA